MEVVPPFGHDTVLQDGPEQPLPPAPVVMTSEPACPGVPADPPSEPPPPPADPPLPVEAEGFCRSETSACPQLHAPRAIREIARIPHESAELCDMATNAALAPNRSRAADSRATPGASRSTIRPA